MSMEIILLVTAWTMQLAALSYLIATALDIQKKVTFICLFTIPMMALSVLKAVYSTREEVFLINLLGNVVWLMVLLLKFSKQSLKWNILAFISLYATSILAEMVMWALETALLPDWAADATDKTKLALSGMVLAMVLLFVFGPIYLHLFRQIMTQRHSGGAAVLIGLLITVIFFNQCINGYQMIRYIREEQVVSLLLVFQMAVGCTVPFIMAVFLWLQQRSIQQLSDKQRDYEREKQRFEEGQHRQELFSRIRHDYNAQMAAAMHLLERGEDSAALQLLRQNREDLEKKRQSFGYDENSHL